LGVDVELSLMARRTGVRYLHDVELSAGQSLAPGDHLEIRDEGGQLHVAIAAASESTSFGHRHRLRIKP
jgi:hypothetical protein